MHKALKLINDRIYELEAGIRKKSTSMTMRIYDHEYFRNSILLEELKSLRDKLEVIKLEEDAWRNL